MNRNVTRRGACRSKLNSYPSGGCAQHRFDVERAKTEAGMAGRREGRDRLVSIEMRGQYSSILRTGNEHGHTRDAILVIKEAFDVWNATINRAASYCLS